MDFFKWYIKFRSEIAERLGVDYTINIISWTFSGNHKHFFDKGLTPKKAALEYIRELPPTESFCELIQINMLYRKIKKIKKL